MTQKKLRLVNSHHCSKCDDSLFVITRSMAKTQMYPLKEDHNLPEISKAGMIQTPNKEPPLAVEVVKQPDKVVETQINSVPTPVQPQQPIVVQPQQPAVNRNVLANFPNINPALTYNQLAGGKGQLYQPAQPAQPMAQPSF